MNKTLRMLSLFSGIGGIDLAAQWAGIETVAFCEIDSFCQQVLRKHWPNVPIFGDIFSLNKEWLNNEGIDTGSIDIVAGGFPCQPFSVAGKRRGTEDDRYLWPEMFRIIQETRPRWVVGENVSGFVNMALDETLSQLEGEGYKTQSFLIPACAIGADFNRNRCFVVANNGKERINGDRSQTIFRKCQLSWVKNGRGFEEIRTRQYISTSGLCRNYHGIPRGVDRVAVLGNSVVPQHIYPIFQAIAIIERYYSEEET